MATYLNLETGKYPFSLEDIRKVCNRVSLPVSPTDDQLRKVGFIRVRSTPKPEGTYVKEGYPRYTEGSFYQTWTIDEGLELKPYKERIKKRITQAYQKRVTENIEHDGVLYDTTASEELHFVFLECLFLRDRNSKETVLVYDHKGMPVELTWEKGLEVIEQIVTTRRVIKKEHAKQIGQLRDCVSVEQCRQLERRFNQKGVFSC